jgi:hypothetical protein
MVSGDIGEKMNGYTAKLPLTQRAIEAHIDGCRGNTSADLLASSSSDHGITLELEEAD